jgi:hypothetical protein
LANIKLSNLGNNFLQNCSTKVTLAGIAIIGDIHG